jgi:hypothetical protein
MDWDEDFGDRKNELVFIGQEMDNDELKKALENCLLTPAEIIDYRLNISFKNPFRNVLR